MRASSSRASRPPRRPALAAGPRTPARTRALALLAATTLAALAAVLPTQAALAAPLGVTGAVLAPVAAASADVATTLAAPCGNRLVTVGGVACGGAVTMAYGEGVQQQLVSYQAGGRTFTVLPSDEAAVTAEVLRVDNATATGDRENIWVANSIAGAPFTGVSGDPTGRTMADVLSSPFVTEGSDNLFGNVGGITTNDVERFSVLRDSPLTASDPASVAVSIVERGGNDAFKLAAVTAVDAAGAPVAWGPIVSVPTSAWGPILPEVTSTVLQQLPGTTGYRPLDYTAAQTIAGVSVSLTDLGVLPGQPLFGVSLVGNDETSMSGPFTTTTNETTAGGLDLVSAVFATAVQPVASPTAVTGTQGAAQVLPVTAAPGDPLVPLDPAATRLEAPAGATVDPDGAVVIVPGEGRYELDRAAGTVVFTPYPRFTGTATPVPYIVTDAAGATAASTLTPTVTIVAEPDVSTGEQGVVQRLAVTENDGGAVPVAPATLRLVDAAGLDADTVVVPGEGAWTVDGEVLVFAPEPAFVGTATPVGYRVDTATGDVVESTATPTVTAAPVEPPAPVVTVPDVVVTAPDGDPAVIDLPAAVPDLVPDSVALVEQDGAPTDELVTDDGTWEVRPAVGEVVFTPAPTLVGDPTPVAFAGERTDGTAVTGRLGVDYVAAAPGPTPAPVPPTPGPEPTPAPAPTTPVPAPAPTPAPAPGSGTAPGAGAGTGGAAPSGALAWTGADAAVSVAVVLGGILAVFAGLALVTVGRRRQ